MKQNIVFEVATDLDYYGYGATNKTPREYAKFAKRYLEGRGYQVEITYTLIIHSDDLHDEVWQAYCNN